MPSGYSDFLMHSQHHSGAAEKTADVVDMDWTPQHPVESDSSNDEVSGEREQPASFVGSGDDPELSSEGVSAVDVVSTANVVSSQHRSSCSQHRASC